MNDIFKPLVYIRYAFLIEGDRANHSFLFDTTATGLTEITPKNTPDTQDDMSGKVPYMLVEHFIPEYKGNWKIVTGDDIPENVTRWQCLCDGCEMAHCSRCGCHYDPYVVDGRAVCDGCQIQDASDQMQAETEAFGDSESACRWHEGTGEFAR